MKKSLSLVILLALAAPASAEDAFVFATNGCARAVIVAPADGDGGLRYAANMLSKFLSKMTGTGFAVSEKPVEGWNCVIVGSAYKAGAKEEIFLRVRDSRTLEVTGDGAIGTLYAVYDLLETLGCEFVAHDFDYVPQKSSLSLPAGYVKKDAPFMYEMREAWQWATWRGPFEFATKLRLDTAIYARGGKLVRGAVAGLVSKKTHRFNHAIYPGGPLLNARKYFKEHPEWYAVNRITGKRNRQWVCVSNEEMFKTVIAEIDALLAKDPSASEFSIAEGDCAIKCECDGCRELEKRYPDPDGTLVADSQVVYFANRIARHFAAKYPNVRFNILPYGNRAPLNPGLRYADNLGGCVAELWRNHGLPADCNERSITCLQHVAKQSTKCSPYIWEYLANFHDFLSPFPNAYIFAQNVRYYKSLGVRGVSCQHQFPYVGDVSELKLWLYAKLLWNPDADLGELVRRYTDAAYGAGARHIREYLDLMENARLRQRFTWYGCYQRDTSQYLTGSDCVRIMKTFDNAVSATAKDPPRNTLVRRARIAALLMRIWRYNDMIAPAKKLKYRLPSYEACYREFYAALNDTSNGCGKGHYLAESPVSIPKSYAMMATNVPNASVLKPACGPVRVVRADELTGGRKMTKQTDPDGTRFARFSVSLSKGEEEPVFMNTKYAEIGYDVKKEEVGEWYVFVTLRVGTTVPVDLAGAYVGIYQKWWPNGVKVDGDKKMEVVDRPLVTRRSENGKWRTVCIGKRRLYEDSRIWVMPGVLNETTGVDVKSITLVEPDAFE